MPVDNADEPVEEPAVLQCVIKFFFNFVCRCGWRDSEEEHVQLPGEASLMRPASSRPLQDVAETRSLLSSDPSTAACHMNYMSPQDRQFMAMKKPSFTTGGHKRKSSDDDSCLICLDDFTEDNPRINLGCGHGFHLACMLEWQERGNNICPVCETPIGGLVDEM